MPLIKPDYYTFQEALDLIKGILPDEDALENLRQFLHSHPSAAWIIDEDGQRVKIPNLWLSVSPKCHLMVSVEQGTAKFQEPGGLGAWRRPAVEGPIRIDRAPLDALCTLISVPRKAHKQITNQKHLAWVSLAGEIAREAKCPKFQGKPNVSAIADRIRKRGTYTEDAATIRRVLYENKSWRS